MDKKVDNLALWNRVEKTNPAFTKEINIKKRKYTAIDPAYQIKNATKEFGPYGGEWGLKNIQWSYIDIGDTKLASLSAIFFTPFGQVETGNAMKMSYKTSSGYITVDEDYRKKLITNTISKELSRLGFNSDVFQGKFEDDKYVKRLEKEAEQTKTDIEKARVLKEIKEITDLGELREYYKVNTGLGKEIDEIITNKSKELNENS